jgi:alkylation response protein AidB-like acyl-CoA dehydrogenase
MFTMMNNARLAVGLQGLAITERAYQQARDFAMERKTSDAPSDKEPRSASWSTPTSGAC